MFYAKADYAVNRAAIANPHICGALFQVIWSEVEKENGRCDWSELDGWIKPWLEADKKVAIRFMWSTSGYWPKPYYRTPTPSWVWDEGAVFAYHEPSRTEIPLIWDPIYEKYAWRFLAAIAERYDANPNVLFFDVTPGAETNPYRFGTINRRNPEFKEIFLATKTSDGRSYTEDLWLESIHDWVDAADRIFERTPLLVTLNVGGLQGASRMGEIGDYCVEHGFYVGQNGLRGGGYGTRTPFHDWADETKLFFEMVARSGRRTGSLQEVMEAAERVGCSYLNVYPEDVLQGTRGQPNYDPAYETALEYGARVLGQGAGSDRAADAPDPTRERDASSPHAEVNANPAVADFTLDGQRWTCQADGKPLEGILVKPEGDGPFPAILVSHGLGSSGAQFGMGKAREFAKWGFVSIAPNYTHARGSGADRSEFGASDENLRRARACLAILESLPYVDRDRFAAYGNSMGAFLTVRLAAAEPERIKATAITAGGITSQRGFAAPTSDVGQQVRTPMLILHGAADPVVPPERSELLKTALDRQGTPNERHLWEGVGHNLHQEHADEVYAKIRAWFEKHGVLK